MQTVPLTVLAYDGPIVRAYLCAMRRQELRPARIVVMVLQRRVSDGRTVGRWLPGGLRTAYQRWGQDRAHNHWPRQLRMRHPALVKAVAASMATYVSDPSEFYAEMYTDFRFERYADSVETWAVDGYRDGRLHDNLQQLGQGVVLYTGGGIVPPGVIGIAGLRFLHVHPGYLPHVRGADGLLWSALVRGRPGATAFYLDKEIDTGDILLPFEFDPLTIELGRGARPDDLTLYRSLFGFADPLIRAAVLVRLLTAEPPLAERTPIVQSRSDGLTYHFMTPQLRCVALERIFPAVVSTQR